ncbi:putative UDP-glucuronosyltransferase 2A3 [Xylogone sp. PMI_703]|nr:putative UDP-glucuronosyltransferase 2A3 [Xylogone sp. PMI_703]
MADNSKPLILACSTPIIGHLSPFREICRRIIERGYDVTLVTGSAFRPLVEAIGANFVPLEGYADFTEADINVRWAARNDLPPGPEQLLYDIENIFLNSIPEQTNALQRATKILKEAHPGRKIVVLSETSFFGSIALKLGAADPSIAGVVGVGLIPIVLSSVDLAPFGLGLPPENSPEGKARYAALRQQFDDLIYSKLIPICIAKIKEAGAVKQFPDFAFTLDLPYLVDDRFVQMCTPSIEYHRSDAPPTLRFSGGLPRSPAKNVTHPPWWGEMTAAASQGKKIAFVCQGTIAIDVKELVLPTLEAFKSNPEWIVVASLGRKGLTLPDGTVVPENAYVEDYILFDEILRYSSVFVTNGGYGAMQHGIYSGVPMIMAGATEDKPEVSTRAEWAGIAVNLRTATPTSEQIKNAAEELTTNPKYKKRVEELQEEMKGFDPVGVVISNIEEVAAGKPVEA